MLSKFYQTASISTLKIFYDVSDFDLNFPYILIPQVSHNVYVSARIAYKLSLEEGNVNDGGVEVYELEDENFEGEIIVKI